MGLFNLFKKEPTHEQKVQALYQCVKDRKMFDAIYPGGEKQASKVISSIALICGSKISKCGYKEYTEFSQIFSEITAWRIVTGSSPQRIKELLIKRHPELVPNEDIARKIYVFTCANMGNHKFSLEDPKDKEEFQFFLTSTIDIEKITKKNDDVINKNLQDDDYGLVATKPVYVAGKDGSRKYLDNLVGENGEFLMWERVGTLDVDNINGIVDIYDATTNTGDTYIRIYLNFYSNTTSNTTPKGLLSKQDISNKLKKFLEVMKTETYESNEIRNALVRGQNPETANYGLSETNPIITSEKTFEDYLARLRTSNKELLFWLWIGTIPVNELHGISNVPVERYQTYLNGEKYETIYICFYGKLTSYVPQKFSLAEKSFPGHNGNLEKTAESQGYTIQQMLAMQKLDFENEQLKKDFEQRKKAETEKKNKRAQAAALDVIKKHPDFCLEKELENPIFAALINSSTDMTTLYEYVHRGNLFKKMPQEQSVSNDTICDANYYFSYLKSTIDPPVYRMPTQDEAIKSAEEMGMTSEQYTAMKRLENENIQLEYENKLEKYQKWAKQAEALKKEYPQFEIKHEYVLEEFKSVLNVSDMKTAFEIIHFPELFVLKSQDKPKDDKTSNIFCRRCGVSIPSDSVFCYKCGTKVEI